MSKQSGASANRALTGGALKAKTSNGSGNTVLSQKGSTLPLFLLRLVLRVVFLLVRHAPAP